MTTKTQGLVERARVGVNPYDEPVAIYVGLLEKAFAEKGSLHYYQQTLDTLKIFREKWVEGAETQLAKALWAVVDWHQGLAEEKIVEAGPTGTLSDGTPVGMNPWFAEHLRSAEQIRQMLEAAGLERPDA